MRLKFRIIQAAEKLQAMNTPFKFPLLDLPNELIAVVIENLDSIKALRRLTRTCRRIQHLTEPVLYRNILLRTGPDTDDVVNAISARPQRAAGIMYLDIPCAPSYEQNFPAIANLISQSKNLRELMIESPECNTSDFEQRDAWMAMTESLFRPVQSAVALGSEAELSIRPLQKLRRLTLHLNGCDSPYWTLNRRSISLFLLPMLQYLKVSCVNILDDCLEHSHNNAPTQLKHLELEECNVSHKGLHGILSLPRALEVLYLGENCHNIRHFGEEVDPSCNHLFQTDPEASVKALQQQQHSLKTLTYVTTETYYQNVHFANRRNPGKVPVDGGFADFHVLKKVVLVGQCPDFERAMMTSRSPPNLETIEFKAMSPFRRELSSSAEDGAMAMVPFLRAPSASVPPTLRVLDVTFDATPLNLDFKLSEVTKTFIRSADKATEKIGVSLRVFYKRHSNYFPPYLYGEPQPEETMVFAGMTEGFVGRLATNTSTTLLDEEMDSEWESDDSSSTETDDEAEQGAVSGGSTLHHLSF